jgi:hypothetical protein
MGAKATNWRSQSCASVMIAPQESAQAELDGNRLEVVSGLTISPEEVRTWLSEVGT